MCLFHHTDVISVYILSFCAKAKGLGDAARFGFLCHLSHFFFREMYNGIDKKIAQIYSAAL